MKNTGIAHFILYVADQQRSRDFYALVLEREPSLHVQGMTEFTLASEAVLGLMPESSIRSLLGNALPDPAQARGVPRSELYLVVPEPELFHQRAVKAGAIELSPLAVRSWGHAAAYSMDPDNHVLVFAADTCSDNSSTQLSSAEVAQCTSLTAPPRATKSAPG